MTELERLLCQRYNYFATRLITINYQLKINKKYIFTKNVGKNVQIEAILED